MFHARDAGAPNKDAILLHNLTFKLVLKYTWSLEEILKMLLCVNVDVLYFSEHAGDERRGEERRSGDFHSALWYARNLFSL